VLRDALLDGRFQPGQDINDMELAKEFGVSRGPVREALLGLVKEGLVEHNQNRGFRILKVTVTDLQQMAQVRLPLETLALQMAKESITPADLEHLHRLKRQLLATFIAVGVYGCARAELEFHTVIWKLTGNPWIEVALRQVAVPYFVYVSAFRLNREDLTEALFDEQHSQYLQFLDGTSDLSALETVERHLSLGGPHSEVCAPSLAGRC
jgi:DNA-binding GntR family transcriptional regulator